MNWETDSEELLAELPSEEVFAEASDLKERD